MSDFEDKLKFGNDGELFFKEIFMLRGCSIVPTYDYTSSTNQSPRLYYKGGHVVIPDLDCGHANGRFWAECKHYTTSPWNRRMKCNMHGLKRRLYDNYLDVQRRTATPVWLFILERSLTHEDGSIDVQDVVLTARLDTLTVHECQCRGCRGLERDCAAPIPHSVYFRRDQFLVLEIPDNCTIAA
jgi:hypothetical protein